MLSVLELQRELWHPKMARNVSGLFRKGPQGPVSRKSRKLFGPEKPFVKLNEGVVSKETVVLRRWGSSIQKFGFINGVDNVNWPPYRDSKS